MGLLTLLGFGLFFVIGILVGVVIENQHQKDERRKESIKYWRWANDMANIEKQMLDDGWKI